jgi:Tol biopolymer transport system component
MPELREVFEMTTKQMEPDVDAWREQQNQQRRSSRNKRLGAFAAAAIAVVGVVLVFFLNRTDPDTTQPGTDTSPRPRTAISAPFFLDLQTGERTPLPESLHGGSLYFVSPDRTMLVINSCCSPPNPVSVANVDGTGVRQVTLDGVDGFAARWSPDGSSLVYQGRDAATAEIGNLFVVDVTTRETTRITDLDPVFHGAWSMHPSFSADGQTIIFHMPRGPDDASTRFDLWRVPVAGGELTLVVRNASTGVYAPDGETLAYLDSPRGDASSSRLMLADVDGSDPRLLVEGDQVESPRWSPDATRIAYSDTDGTHVVDVSTGEASLVTADAAVLDWFGNDTLVVIP